MMTVVEKLRALRAAMSQSGVDCVFVPSSDPHMSEYLPDHWRSRAWLSGFTGSAGTLCVAKDSAALWTDGRYFIQAERELAGSGIELMKMAQPKTPTVEQWVSKQLPRKGVLALDGSCTSASKVETLEKACKEKEISIQNQDFIQDLWTQDRPSVPASEAWLMDPARSGMPASDKITALRGKLAEKKADAMLVCRLDSVAWLLNLRANDIRYTPFALAYCLVEPSGVRLFIDGSRVSDEVRGNLQAQGVTLYGYDAVQDYLAANKSKLNLLYDPASTNWSVLQVMQKNEAVSLIPEKDPIQLLKAVKNDTEMECQREAHRRDGVAMVRFERELRRRMESGETWTEMDASDYLLGLRMQQEGCLGASFETIAAYRENAAMMHYSPKTGSCATIQPRGFLLVDSGGQYTHGTTDITRTFAVGPLTDEERDAYTLVLKSHIAVARAVFKSGSAGRNIDIIAREPMWRRGLDYRCGTGHGVGFVGLIHEGPQGMSAANDTPFVPGMTVTDEPGLYEEGKFGIRIENELVCVPVTKTEYGDFYGFEVFTYCPIDTRPLIVESLTDEELEWLNEYHALVYRELKGALTEEEAAWLKEACAPVTR